MATTNIDSNYIQAPDTGENGLKFRKAIFEGDLKLAKKYYDESGASSNLLNSAGPTNRTALFLATQKYLAAKENKRILIISRKPN